MARLTHNSDFGDQGLLYHLALMIQQYHHLRKEYLYDSRALEIFDWSINHLNKFETLINQNVRFDYLELQGIIDKKYKEDNQLTGFIIYFDFVDTNNPNRGVISYQVKTQKNHMP